MKTVTYAVPDISCMHCVHTIQMELADVQGVKSVKADQISKMVERSVKVIVSRNQLPCRRLNKVGPSAWDTVLKTCPPTNIGELCLKQNSLLSPSLA